MKRMNAEEIRKEGERFYRRLKPHLEPKLNGKVIVIDIKTGLYVFGDDVYEADRTFSHLMGKKAVSYGRKIGPDPYTQRVGA